MPLVVRRSHGVNVIENVVTAPRTGLENKVSWRHNAMLEVRDSAHFSMEIRSFNEACLVDQDQMLLFGICSEDTDMNVDDLEESEFDVLMFEMHDGALRYFDKQSSCFEDCMALSPCAERISRICLTFKDGNLHFAFNMEPAKLLRNIHIPPVEYRPCITLGDGMNVFMWIDRPGSKRKAEHVSTQASKVARSLWLSKDFADAKIVCGQENSTTIPVHRCILSAASPFFERSFKSGMREDEQATVALPDVEPEVVSLLLSFLYTGSMESDWRDHVYELLPLAHRLEITEMVELCVSAVTETVSSENAFKVIFALKTFRDDPVIGPYWKDVADQLRNLVCSDAGMMEQFMLAVPSPAA